jgi:hypothetical protein
MVIGQAGQAAHTVREAGHTVREAALILGRSEPALRHMILRRELPVVRFGHRVFVLQETIADLLAGRLVVDSPK